MKFKHLIGIDEVGRGPLAGPVMVGVFCVEQGYDMKQLSDIRDSKQLNEKKREEIYEFLNTERKEGRVDFVTPFITAKNIDTWGISRAIAVAIARGLVRIDCDPAQTKVLLDGLLKAPKHFLHQQTIIKGDQKELLIGAASIVAKVRRDRMMVRQARKYPQYGFEQHKGYGTLQHRQSIKKHGKSTLHRLSFLKNL